MKPNSSPVFLSMLSLMPHPSLENIPPAFLDARKLRCPMPSVHLRMKLDNLEANQALEMLGCGETARSNAETLLAMLHYPTPKLVFHDTETGEWKLFIPAKQS